MSTINKNIIKTKASSLYKKMAHAHHNAAPGGHWKETFGLLKEMGTSGIPKNTIPYNAAISACGDGGQWEKALAPSSSSPSPFSKLSSEQTRIYHELKKYCYRSEIALHDAKLRHLSHIISEGKKLLSSTGSIVSLTNFSEKYSPILDPYKNKEILEILTLNKDDFRKRLRNISNFESFFDDIVGSFTQKLQKRGHKISQLLDSIKYAATKNTITYSYKDYKDICDNDFLKKYISESDEKYDDFEDKIIEILLRNFKDMIEIQIQAVEALEKDLIERLEATFKTLEQSTEFLDISEVKKAIDAAALAWKKEKNINDEIFEILETAVSIFKTSKALSIMSCKKSFFKITIKINLLLHDIEKIEDNNIKYFNLVFEALKKILPLCSSVNKILSDKAIYICEKLQLALCEVSVLYKKRKLLSPQFQGIENPPKKKDAMDTKENYQKQKHNLEIHKATHENAKQREAIFLKLAPLQEVIETLLDKSSRQIF